MEKFEINILGCGSATPTLQHNPSCQVVNLKDKLFMIDCGEGSQLEFRRQRLRFGKINQIFISHLHGDHCFGLIGLISTLGLLGRTGELIIHAPEGIEAIFNPLLDFFCRESPYSIIFNTFNPTRNDLIYEDRGLKVSTIPLRHRVPCAGFLFKEKEKEPNLKKNILDKYEVPLREIPRIKSGEDFILSNGKIIKNDEFIANIKESKSYAYCSDTVYDENIIPIIEGIDLLYHEATFDKLKKEIAKERGHSTTYEAAEIAKKARVKKLMIGHFSSRYDNNQLLLEEAKEIFPNTILANEGLCVSV